MNLTSLRQSYSTLLESFKEAGVTLNESQQGNLDQFMIALEKKITETRDAAIRTTKKMVTEKLDAEYRTLTEQLIKHMQENAELTAKIQKQVDESNKTQELAEAVDEYLGLYVEEILPKKSIVDYSEMKKLQRIHESLKNMLQVSETATAPVEEPTQGEDTDNTEKKPEETVPPETPAPTTESADEAKNTDIKKTNNNKKIPVSHVSAEKFLESKVKDLPEREAKFIKESLKNASVSEIKMKFKALLESAREEISETAETSQVQQEKSLEEALTDIMNEETYSNVNKTNDGNPDEGKAPADPETDDGSLTGLEESEDLVVDESYMKLWMSRC